MFKWVRRFQLLRIPQQDLVGQQRVPLVLGPLLVPIPRLAHHQVPHPADAVSELVVEGPLYANLSDKNRVGFQT
jgi:hypothetical protein